VSMEGSQSPRCREIIGGGLMITGIVVSVVLPHRARALAHVAFGGLAILLLLFLLLKPVTSPYSPEEAEPRAEVRDSGEWVIPERIVMCESSGQNLPSNEAGAAGYYQITSEAWAEGDGSPPDDASQHSKAEQDAVASRLWAAGTGAGRWVCK